MKCDALNLSVGCHFIWAWFDGTILDNVATPPKLDEYIVLLLARRGLNLGLRLKSIGTSVARWTRPTSIVVGGTLFVVYPSPPTPPSQEPAQSGAPCERSERGYFL